MACHTAQEMTASRGGETRGREDRVMHLDLTAVQSFIAVADCRHFGRAAERLGISVSALTKRIQRLESSVGVPLIERDS
ncbi:MAG: helix-turn-helix domain-containing protein, partial [Aeromicrobium sp.]